MKTVRYCRKLMVAGFIAIVVLAGSKASAAIVQVDWLAAGDNLLTEDTSTGLRWLDFTQTAGQSFDAVSTQLGVGGAFDGFNYATSAQVETFWTNAGIPTISVLGDFQAANFTPVSQLTNLIGGILDTTVLPFSNGLTATTGFSTDFFGNTTPFRVTGRLQLCEGHTFPNGFTCPSSAVAALWNNTLSDNLGDSTTGSYLVMDTNSTVVPLPAALPLYGTGLAVMGFIGWRRRRKVAGVA